MVNLEWIEDLGWIYLRQPDDLLLKEQSARRFDNKSHKWVADSVEGFVVAPVTVVEGKELTIRMPNNEKIKVNIDEAQSINPAKYDKAEDLTSLQYLNEASVLYTLRQRFSALLTYTYAGSVCIFLNPYKQLPIYTETVANMYLGQRRSEMPPHLFAIADQAYRNMIHEKRNQSLIITGESGSGKTENTKEAIVYYTRIGQNNIGGTREKRAVRFQDQLEKSLEHRLIEVNHLLASFGNAATGRNINSSRYERYIVNVIEVLLEKSRVVKQFPQERSFHIFYQLISNRKICEICLLERDIKKYKFVCQAETHFHGLDDSNDYKRTDKALSSFGITEEERHSIYKICASVLHLSQLKAKTTRNTSLAFDGNETVQRLCLLLGLDRTNFTEAILRPKLKGKDVQQSLTVEQVHSVIADLACTIYTLLFSWLIASQLQYNTFERFWINFVNEKLQQYFNNQMFSMEQEEYRQEKLKWQLVDFGHNLQPCINLIQLPSGILGILNKESESDSGSNDALYIKLNANFSDRWPYYRPEYMHPKTKKKEFTVLHYAGQVRYSVDDWVEKNRSLTCESLISVFKTASDKTFFPKLWENYPEGRNTDSHCVEISTTYSTAYTNSLSKLFRDLEETQPHFVRCIVPNDLKQSAVFDGPLILNQLSCNGILEALRICRNGYPEKLSFAEFRNRYSIIATSDSTDVDDRNVVEAMLQTLQQKEILKENQFQMGQTKVYFKHSVLHNLEKLREIALSDVIVQLQSACRFYLARLHYLSLNEKRLAILTIQQNVLAWIQMQNSRWVQLYFHLKPLIPLLTTKRDFAELSRKIEELEESREADAVAKAAIEKELEEERNNAAEIKREFEEKRKQLQKEKEATVRAVLTELQEEFDMIKVEKENLERNNALVLRENEKLKSDIQELTQKLEKREIADAESRQRTMAEKQSSTVSDGTQSDNTVPGTSGLDASYLSSSRNPSYEEMELMRRKYDRLETRKKELQQMTDDYERQIHSLKQAKEESNRGNSGAELNEWRARLNHDADLINKLQSNTKKLIARIEELEAELHDEQQSKLRVEKQRSDLQKELDLINEEVYETNSHLNAQMQINKLRQIEVRGLQKAIEERSTSHEKDMADLLSLQWLTVNSLRNLTIQVHLVATLAICVVDCNVHCLPAFSVLCLNTYIIHTCIMRANKKKKSTGRQGLNDEVKRVEEKGKQMETGRVRAP
ncbi:unnamed protein product [Enterobius vermicularis]|uniref:Myosin motor domain-containing protein n=1 Tax=Enterobius vermicularis TaxID=51028 RepID=A0A158Q9K2_ENTVE|nr:unnamed protein product [Enterobius vermicularis]